MPEKDLHGFLIFGKMCKITSKKLKKCISINKVPPTDFKFTSAGEFFTPYPLNRSH